MWSYVFKYLQPIYWELFIFGNLIENLLICISYRLNNFSLFITFFLCLSSVQLLSCVWFFATPWTAARQASLSGTNSQSLLKLRSIKSVIPSNHLTLCHPLLLLPSSFPSIRVFSIESVLYIMWPKYWSFGGFILIYGKTNTIM